VFARAGLYMIERDARGERSFLYWRDRAPAREFFDRVDDAALERLSRFDWLYLSGISLSLYGEAGRARLTELLGAVRRNGGRVAFDGNYPPRGWGDTVTARRAFNDILPLADLNFLGDRPGAAPVRRQQNYPRPLQIALQRHR
jgi:2-dehydro-3-deoxygluconokinase